jgi:hypothetical protein
MKRLDIDDTIPSGAHAGKTVREIIETSPADLLDLDPADPPNQLLYFTPETQKIIYEAAEEQWSVEAFEHAAEQK